MVDPRETHVFIAAALVLRAGGDFVRRGQPHRRARLIAAEEPDCPARQRQSPASRRSPRATNGPAKGRSPCACAAALAQSPLLPGQIEQLREVVAQVFLSADDYHKDPADPRGFAGLSWGTEVLNESFASGIPVQERIPGFPAFRVLQSGDIITGVLEQPQTPLHKIGDFIAVVLLMRHGSVVHLSILRSGHPVSVALTLDDFPVDLDKHRDTVWVDNWILAQPAGRGLLEQRILGNRSQYRNDPANDGPSALTESAHG